MGQDNEYGKPKPRKPAQFTLFGATPKRKLTRSQIKKIEFARRQQQNMRAWSGTPAQRAIQEAERRGQMRLDDAPGAPKVTRSNPLSKGNSGKLGGFFIGGVGLAGLQSFSGGIDDLWGMGQERDYGRVGGGGSGGIYDRAPKKK